MTAPPRPEWLSLPRARLMPWEVEAAAYIEHLERYIEQLEAQQHWIKDEPTADPWGFP